MKVNLLIFPLLSLLCCSSNAQTVEMKSTAYGLDLMLRDFPKKTIIDEMRFEHGKDSVINVVRFDHVGPSLKPLIVSSKLPLPTDSLGILSFTLQKDSLQEFLDTIDKVNPKAYSRNLDFVLIRITYRLDGRLEQYYVTNARVASAFLRMIESRLTANGDPEVLHKFYEFVAPMNLLTVTNRKLTWKY
jgi:hypothetical protein